MQGYLEQNAKDPFPDVYNTGNNLTKSYLTNVKQFVAVNVIPSDVLPVTVEVPQGSVVRPLLFSMFISDRVDAPGIKSTLFADNTVSYVEDESAK